MSSETTNTQLDFIIPELWQPTLLAQMYDGGQAINRFQRVDGDVKGKGDILHLPAMPSLTVNDVSSAGAVTNQTVTPTEAQLTVDTWKDVTMALVDKADIQSIGDVIGAFNDGAAGALGQKIDSDILALVADANFGTTNTTQGDGTQPLDEDSLAGAFGELLEGKFAPALRDPNRVSYFLHAGEWKNLKKVAPLTSAQYTGSSSYAVDKMALPNFYGVPYFISTQVRVASSVRFNFLGLRESLAVGVQRNVQMLELPRADLARRFCLNVLYGVKVRSEPRGVILKSRDV